MKTLRVAVWGMGTLVEEGVLPALSGLELMSPPDVGRGWAKRPARGGDIRYQPPASPELVAMGGDDLAAVERLAFRARVRARYGDLRAMLREAAPDALLLSPSAGAVNVPGVLRELAAKHTGLKVALFGPPALSGDEATRLANELGARAENLWIAKPLSRAFAHRGARRAVEDGKIGSISALSLRFSTAFPASEVVGEQRFEDEARRLNGAFAALSLLLEAARWKLTDALAREEARGFDESGPLALAQLLAATASESATSLLLRAESAGATALFSPTDAWNSGLPRLELMGSEGRFLVCDGGRTLTLHVPREAAQRIEPPGSALGPSAPNLAGITDELRAFFAWCAEGTARHERALADLQSAARVLRLIEEVGLACRTGEVFQRATPPSPESIAEPRARAHSPSRASREKSSVLDAPALPL